MTVALSIVSVGPTQKSAAMMTKQMRMFQSATNLIPLSMPSTAEPV